MDEIKQVDLESKDLVAERIEQMKALFPEIATEGEGVIDFEKLRLILGDEVNEGDERYAFTWPGKADAVRQSQTVSTATLRPCPEESVNWDTTQNLFIEGDNLEVLKLLQRGYHGKVKMIYIDPPYNTGHDFVYKDRFGDSIRNYIEQAGLVGQSNANTNGRYHSDWCSMMYPRIRLARELLTDDGVIFISIDDNEQKNLSNICDEIFGTSCFVTDLIWRSSDASNNDAKSFSADYNHTLIYSKKPDWQASRLPRREQDNQHYKNPDNDPRGPWFSGNVSSPNPRENLRYEVVSPQGIAIRPPSNGWRWSKERMQEMIDSQEVVFSADGTRLIKKTFLKDQKGIVPSNLWIDLEETGHNRNAKYELVHLFPELPTSALFKTPKPTKLIRKLLKLVDAPEQDEFIVLDFFAGSATTADAVFQENSSDGKRRHFILVQLPEVIPEESEAKSAGFLDLGDMSIERIRRAGKQNRDSEESNAAQPSLLDFEQKQTDVGFRVLKLDDSGITKPKQGQLLIDRIKPGRTDQDIIFEMMLKWGIELTYPIEETEINGYPCYSIAYDELICCMKEGLTVETIEAIASMQPRRVFMLDSILDDTLKLNALQIFKRVEEKTQQKIDLRTV